MKKFFVLLLTMAMLLTGAALAEAPFEGVWVQFDAGFEVLMPGEWLEMEVTEEMLAGGIFYAACSPDGANTVQMSWAALGAPMTIQEIQAALNEVYPGAEVVEFNGIEFVSCSDVEADIFSLTALDGVDLGMYTFWFTPDSDEAFVDTAVAIATSIRNIE